MVNDRTAVKSWWTEHATQIATALIITIACGLLVVFVVASTNNTNDNVGQALYKNQLDGCRDRNKIKKESNRRVKLHRKQNEVDRILASSAAQARLTTFLRAHNPEDFKVYRDYSHALRISKSIKFHMLPIIPCKKKVRKP